MHSASRADKHCRVRPHRLVFVLLIPAVAAGYELDEGVSTKDYNRTGVAINDTAHALAKGISDGRVGSVTALLEPGATFAPGRAPAISGSGLQIHTWTPSASLDAAATAAALVGWRQGLPKLDRVVVKMSELERVRADGSATAVLRFEIIGDTDDVRVTHRGHWRAQLVRRDDGLIIAALELRDGETTAGAGGFVDRARARGIDFYGDPDPRFLPPSDALKFQTARHSIGGVSVADVDGDGWDDALFVGGENARLFVNRGDGSFDDRTADWGLASIRHSNVTLFADFDGDGDADLYVGYFFGRNQLFENVGHRFVDVTEASGLGADDQVASLAAGDLNGDGYLDLYVGRFLDTSKRVPQMIHYTRNGEPNRLYLGGGDLTFSDVSEASGADDVGLTLGIAVGDYDRDGDQDLYLANDFGRNVLLQNRGDGTFEDVAKAANAQAISGGMASSFGDFDGDGILDIYVSSIRSNQRWFSQDLNVRGYLMNLVQSGRRDNLQQTFLDLRETLGDEWAAVGQHELSGNYLLRGTASGRFEDVSVESGTQQYGWYWGSGFVDVDNDGRLDIYAVNGWISGEDKHDL